MSEFDIRVVGAPPPRKTEGRFTRRLRGVGRVAKAALERPRAVACGGLAAFVLFVGTPHVGWNYECRVPIRFGEPCPAYFSCSYYGIQGRRVVFPRDGEACSLVKFLPIAWDRII